MNEEWKVWALTLFNHKESWVLELGLLFICLLLLYLVVKNVLRTLEKKGAESEVDWRTYIRKAIRLPLTCMMLLLGVTFSIDILVARFLPSVDLSNFDAFRSAAIAANFSWLVLRWKSAVQKSLLSKTYAQKIGVDRSATLIIGKLVSIVILIITFMVILQVLGLDVAPLLAFGGIGAASIGFAGKDVIANFFGGLMLYMNRSFTIGDLIMIPDKNIQGHVEEIGWYITAIRDRDKRPMYLPNAIFSTVVVINSTRMSHRRVLEKIAVSYSDASRVSHLTHKIREEVKAHPEVDTEAPINIYFDKFEEYSLSIALEFYVHTVKWEPFLELKESILLRIYEIIKEEGGTIPYPVTIVKLDKDCSL